MNTYYERRPRFEAIQLTPENVKELSNITGTTVAFSDIWCFIRIEGDLVQLPQKHWLVIPPNGKMTQYSPGTFNAMFEPIEDAHEDLSKDD